MLRRAPTGRRHYGQEPFSLGVTWVSSSDYVFGDDRPDGASPNVVVDITDTMDQKIEVCRTTWAFAELPDDFDEVQRTAHAGHGRPMGLKYAEVFEGPLPRAKVDYLTA